MTSPIKPEGVGRRVAIGGILGLALIGVTVGAVALKPGPYSDSSPSDAKAIATVIGEAENVRMAMTAPPPAQHDRKYSDDRSSPAVAHVDSSGRRNYLSDEEKSAMRSTGRSDLVRLFTPEMVDKLTGNLENSILRLSNGGNFLRSSAGATVTTIESIEVDGNSAKAKAKVTVWGTVGEIRPETGEIQWVSGGNDLDVTYSLVRAGGNQWLVSQRDSKFSHGGTGP